MTFVFRSILSAILVPLWLAGTTAIGQNVVINEIMYHPYHQVPGPEDVNQEYIELLNLGPDGVDLAGWRISDGVEFAFPGIWLGPGQYVVVAADVEAFRRVHPAVTNVVGGWTGSLKDSGERIELVDGTGSIVDVVEYADDGDWAVRYLGPPDHGHRGWQWSDQHDGWGSSLELINPNMPNEYGQNWSASNVLGGTPGRANSVTAADTPPFILDVRHQPLFPGPNQEVTVTAVVIDERSEGIGARVYYRSDGRIPFSYAQMFDDGLHNDGRAGDGVYGAWIPAYPDKAVVEFYVEAIDRGGLSRTWPAPCMVDGRSEQVANALYLVDSSAYLDLAPGQQPIYHLIMTDSERAELALIGSKSNGEEDSDAMMNGTFIAVEGTGVELRYRVGIRNRGHGTRTGPPNNYHVSFLNSEPWKGLTGINFNCRYTHAQILGSAIFRLAGLAAAEAWPAQVRINGENLAVSGSPMYGCYVRLEAFNGDFARRHFPADPHGNLYTCFRMDAGSVEADLKYEGATPEPYRNRYFKANNQSADDWSDFLNMLDVLAHAPQDRYLQEVSKVINIQQWLRYVALDALLLNYETGLNRGIGDDFFMYAGASDRRFVLIPHDLDTILGEGNSRGDIGQSLWSIVDGVAGSDGVDGLRRFFDHPDTAPLYYQAVKDLLGDFFDRQHLDPIIDQILKPFTPISRINAIKQFIDQRIAAVSSQIPTNLVIDPGLPEVAGYPRTVSGTLRLDGTADATRTRSVTVNGRLARWTPRSGTWSLGDQMDLIRPIVPKGAVWRYLDDGTDQGSAWTDPDFDDSAWKSGPAQLGYGDGDEATVVSYGPDASKRFITTYFRLRFEVDQPGIFQMLLVRLLRDDGAVVYINGQEVIRDNMPDGQIGYTTRAAAGVSGADEARFYEFQLPINVLRRGMNLVAVEIHQSSGSSSDISFDLAIDGIVPAQGPAELLAGVNRLVVKAFDGPDGTGQQIQEGFADIWYDTGNARLVSGTMAPGQVIWTAEQGPYQVSGELVVPDGTTLTIGPGTSVFFEPGARLTVRGRLVANGSEYQQIRFTRVPLMQSSWSGIQFIDSQKDNLISWAVIEYGRTNDGMVGLTNSAVTLEHVWFDHTDLRRIRLEDSSLVVRDCVFADMFAPDQAPTTDNLSEHIWGSLAKGGRFLVERCRFGIVKGHNDCIDIDGPSRPDGVIEIRDCTFLGGGDDALDLEGDAYIEGNRFIHFHKDRYNTAAHYGNVISAGGDKEYMVVRNIFYDVDHVAQIKNRAFMTLCHNTIVKVLSSCLYFEPPGEPQLYGKGARIQGCIFWDVNEPVFDKMASIQQLTVSSCIIPRAWLGLGQDNIDADPAFVDPSGDWRLMPGSIASRTGPLGLDRGAMVSSGVVIHGLPRKFDWRRAISLSVGGPGIASYRYSLSGLGGPWSQQMPVEIPIELEGLEEGRSYEVLVMGQDWAGSWRSDVAALRWTVDSSAYDLAINEVMAGPGQTDWVEIAYDGPVAMNLAGMSVSDDPCRPLRFVFKDPTWVEPGGYLVVSGGESSQLGSIALGFGLDPDGDALYLFDRDGRLIDKVEFGPQIQGLTIGRWEGLWRLTEPTPGRPNRPCPLGDPRKVRINEWLAAALPNDEGFVELHNPDNLPVDMAGMTITDDLLGLAHRLRFPECSFIPAGGFLVLEADGQDKPGHLPFKLSNDGEVLALIDSNGRVIDRVIFGPQYGGVSEGLLPDGGTYHSFFGLPTPGLANMEGL